MCVCVCGGQGGGGAVRGWVGNASGSSLGTYMVLAGTEGWKSSTWRLSSWQRWSS